MRRWLIGGRGIMLAIRLGGGCGLHKHLHPAFQHGKALGLIGDNGIQIINHGLLMGGGFFKLG